MSPSLASSSKQAAVMCLLTDAMSNAVCSVIATPCSTDAQPAVVAAASLPSE